MKRFISLILSLFLLISFCGCNDKKDSFEDPVQFYYRSSIISYNSEISVIRGETQEGSGYDLVGLINKYLQGPITDECLSPFPAGITVLSIETSQGKTYISLNKPFADLSGIALSLACACLSKTVMELTESSVVEISVPNSHLSGNASIIMDAQTILLLDKSF